MEYIDEMRSKMKKNKQKRIERKIEAENARALRSAEKKYGKAKIVDDEDVKKVLWDYAYVRAYNALNVEGDRIDPKQLDKAAEEFYQRQIKLIHDLHEAGYVRGSKDALILSVYQLRNESSIFVENYYSDKKIKFLDDMDDIRLGKLLHVALEQTVAYCKEYDVRIDDIFRMAGNYATFIAQIEKSGLTLPELDRPELYSWMIEGGDKRRKMEKYVEEKIVESKREGQLKPFLPIQAFSIYSDHYFKSRDRLNAVVKNIRNGKKRAVLLKFPNLQHMQTMQYLLNRPVKPYEMNKKFRPNTAINNSGTIFIKNKEIKKFDDITKN